MRLAITPATVASALALAATAPALAASAPDAGEAFEPHPLTRPLYAAPAVSPPLVPHEKLSGAGVDATPDMKETVPASDGVPLYVETYLPHPKDGVAPPARLAGLLIMTPYEETVSRVDGHRRDHLQFMQYFVERGYAVSIAHVRGTGLSGGCMRWGSPQEIDDTATVIHHLATRDWSNGNIGMWGLSYEAMTQITVAASGGDKASALKAIVPMAGAAGHYDLWNRDGVPYATSMATVMAVYPTLLATPGPAGPALAGRAEGCQADEALRSLKRQGDFTAYQDSRDQQDHLGSQTAAVLMSRGLWDVDASPFADQAYFSLLPPSLPKAAVLGQFEHMFPDRHETNADWRRADWKAMANAWYDRFLLGLDTGVERWPAVQVADMSGQWRTERTWPVTDGPGGRLALGPGGRLGVTQPRGSSQYEEVSATDQRGALSFDTGALSAPLHLTGQPTLDLWITLDHPDAHVAVQLDAFDAGGASLFPVDVAGTGGPTPIMGARSARHLDPLDDGRFVQRRGKDPRVGEPIRVRIRLTPLDITVPAGGHLRVTIAGMTPKAEPKRNAVRRFYTAPSGTTGTVIVHHDCKHPSVLRFRMPREHAHLINVREFDEPAEEPLADNPSHELQVDGGGLARAAICNQEFDENGGK